MRPTAAPARRGRDYRRGSVRLRRRVRRHAMRWTSNADGALRSRIRQDWEFLDGNPIEMGAEYIHGCTTLLADVAERGDWPLREVFTWAQVCGIAPRTPPILFRVTSRNARTGRRGAVRTAARRWRGSLLPRARGQVRCHMRDTRRPPRRPCLSLLPPLTRCVFLAAALPRAPSSPSPRRWLTHDAEDAEFQKLNETCWGLGSIDASTVGSPRVSLAEVGSQARRAATAVQGKRQPHPPSSPPPLLPRDLAALPPARGLGPHDGVRG